MIPPLDPFQRTDAGLVEVFALALRMAESLDDLATWWRAHQPALATLSPDALREVVAIKDERKAALASRPPLLNSAKRVA